MWITNVVLKYPDGGPVPDTATYIQKLEREREARERGEAKDNRPYFLKYWMYIVLAFIFVVISSAINPEAAGASGGSVQRQ
ncbi:ER membrane protein complex subunit 10 [Dufourea novaeangliae]|uniref:ER membrane protein complex subunit 10 n=2 Tax=Dufourea novaeangliae TaxID=178035 RepID=A0A154P6Y7_DUFNO|nr:ER membrane protein complex subunit 10 [Dufourea novaeangliae]